MRYTTPLAALLLSSSAVAQGVALAMPPFVNTYSAAQTRGLYFQSPVAFNIVGVQVPDETTSGVQHVEIYVLNAAPPTFTATVTPSASELRFSAYGAPVTGTPIPTGSIAIAPGDWVVAIGACGTGGRLANSYGTAGPFNTTVFGAPIAMNRCGTQVPIDTNNGPNALFSGAGAVSRVELFVTANASFQYPPQLVAVAEAVPLTGTLGTDGGPFRAGEFLRWNFTDPQNNNAGLLIWNALNFGIAGSPPRGQTAQIPGLVQVWPGSSPSGIVDVIGPTVIGAPDTVAPIPTGLFGLGDVIRMQGIALDPRVQTATTLPLNPTLNTIEFQFTDCLGGANFEGVSGLGTYPAGWSNGAGNREWVGNSGGTTSGGTGPTSAAQGTSYFYCETSAPVVVGDVFECNSETISNPSATALNFALSRIGAEIGQLEVLLDDGVNPPTVLATYTGSDPIQAQGAVEWSQEMITLPQPLPASYSITFRYTILPIASSGSTFQGDLAIDDVCVR